MSERKRRLIYALITLTIAATATIGIEKARSKTAANRLNMGSTANAVATTITQASSIKSRNLSLQPEAFKLSKRLGRRFTDAERSISVATGTLTIGSKSQAIVLTRRQNPLGEHIEISLDADPSVLTWDEAAGPKSVNRQATETELAFD